MKIPFVDLPQIDLAILPELDQVVGLFGSLRHITANDSLVVLMTFLFETVPPDAGG